MYKQGIKTSEFWLTAVSAIITAGLTLAAAIHGGDVVGVFAVLAGLPSIAAMIVAYINSRAAVKVGQVGGNVHGALELIESE